MPVLYEFSSYDIKKGSSVRLMQKNEIKSYRDLGLTEAEFLEVVDFFKELLRLDQRGRAREKLVLICRGRLRILIEEQKKILHEQLSRLEKLG